MQAVSWYHKCKCTKQRPSWHPTRLIDLTNLKTTVHLDGERTIFIESPKGLDTLDYETVRIVEKGDPDFPQPGELSKSENARNSPENGEGKPRHPQKHYNRYVTLSHCWGKHRHQVLSRTSKAVLKAGIMLRDLPDTYKQAIQFAARIEDVGWIWTDSLCIIQDDDQDWTDEASDMQRIL